MQNQNEGKVLIMWHRADVSAEPIKCDECGCTMSAMWEERRQRNDIHGEERSTVFHCWRCSADRELIREFDCDGNETMTVVRHYFFG